jgi:hypothetical protein
MAERIKLVIFHLTGAAKKQGIRVSYFRVGMGEERKKRDNPGI